MRTLLLIPILLLAGCIGVNMPLYDRQPEIVKVDTEMGTIKAKLDFLIMIDADLDLVAVKRHIDLIHVFYTAMEVAFANGDTDKYQLMMNRINVHIAFLNALIEEVQSMKPTSLTVPERFL